MTEYMNNDNKETNNTADAQVGGPSKGTEQDSPAEWRLWLSEIPRNKTTKKGINQILSVFGDMKGKKQKQKQKKKKEKRKFVDEVIQLSVYSAAP